MKKLPLFFALLLCTLSLQAQPSWCTAEQLTKVESFICSDSALSEADSLLSHIYSNLMTYVNQKGHKGKWSQKIKKKQRIWLKKRNQMTSKAVLMKSYLEQVNRLYPELVIHSNIEERVNKSLSNIKQIYNAITNNNPNQVASLIQFPTILTVNGQRLILKKKKDFTRRYPALFPEAYRERIMQIKPTPTMFKNDKGIMLGDGILWFTKDGELKAINHS